MTRETTIVLPLATQEAPSTALSADTMPQEIAGSASQLRTNR